MREARALGIFFWIRSEIGYQKPYITPFFQTFKLLQFSGIQAITLKLLEFKSAFMFPIFATKKNSNNNKVNYTPVSKNQNKE